MSLEVRGLKIYRGLYTRMHVVLLGLEETTTEERKACDARTRYRPANFGEKFLLRRLLILGRLLILMLISDVGGETEFFVRLA